jgi:drug/metabolite transporter (DMT)-like permease
LDQKTTDSTPVPVKHWLLYVVLHGIILLYSFAAALSKLAAGFPFLSLGFCLSYTGSLTLLVTYALVWQWILKYLPLTVAYINKGATIIWGIVWGLVFFSESISWAVLLGATLVFIGIILVVSKHD